ncbi:NAD-dependent epimerase/dehydratase family protein [Ponticaulis sp.]|uniref:NAD-dependent epimerase/dehydratase family protein n=1 Tax=Ponticaulis sp. TaxID=2020902 RepID=UPI000B72CE3B|nr:NAD-dependent epimerase/dehydratase family protein [Ponticaulis sp.]MAJ07728.1 UDP-glucuronate 5-epimerase [Ponticaulis sp.]HBH88342.1 UDP-glucuronate 5-epimerase [Hyphomonadaceae bacterium]HBJ93227.1 UDP-glucuronate 5-epimerase [Hyphomonadaceae bacterium]
MKRVFVTGTAGFIGFHLAKLLLEEGVEVHGFDGMTDYYDVQLKKDRNAQLDAYPAFSRSEGLLEDENVLVPAILDFKPDMIVHLAGQAGVRHSIEKPRDYINSNVMGTFNVMDAAQKSGVQHLLMASSSSVYGANTQMPFKETDQTETQLSMYAATKKANESMAHSYANLWNVPTTMFRFFTVYGAWGRPDLAYFKFTDAILNDRPIDIYNHGDMARDFTYVEDLVRGIRLLMDAIPSEDARVEGDSLSPVAPFRVVNIGNSNPVKLLDFIEAIETSIGKEAVRNYMPMQPGDVQATWADATLLQRLTGYKPETDLKDGVDVFVKWYRDYYNR